MLFIVKHDSPKFYVTNRRDDKAREVISQIYDESHNVGQQVLSEIKQTSSVDTNEVSLRDAFWNDEKYSRSSWVAVLLSASVWLCGFQVILNYANNIIAQISDGKESPLDPR